VVAINGTTNLNGNATWVAGDWVLWNGVSNTWTRVQIGAQLGLGSAAFVNLGEGTTPGTALDAGEAATLYATKISPTTTGILSLNSALMFTTSGAASFAILDLLGNILAVMAQDGSPNFAGLQARFAGLGITQQQISGVEVIADPMGNILAALGTDGSPSFAGASAVLAGITMSPSALVPAGTILLVDPYGTILNVWGTSGTQALPAVATYSADEIAQRNAAALARSMIVKGRVNTTMQRPVANYNVCAWYGQSDCVGAQGAPAITVSQPFDCLMYGQSDRPQNVSGTGTGANLFTPVGDTNFHPLVATNQQKSSGALFTPLEGGFQSVTGVTFNEATQTISVSSPTANQIQLVSGSLVSTPVGGSGQPAFDFTQIFAAGDTIAFGGAGLAGLWAPLATIGLNLNPTTIQSVTATTIVLVTESGSDIPSTVPDTPISEVNFYVTNNVPTNFGENPVTAATNMWRKQQLAFRALAADPSRLLVATNSAIGGTTIAQLSKGASPNLYNRVISGVSAIAAKAALASDTCVCPFVTYLQGDSDGDQGTIGSAYSAALATLVANLRADIVSATGQSAPPAFLMYQSSGQGISGPTGVAIAMAQLDFALAPPNPDVYMIGPYYAVPDFGVHLTTNGYRWFGEMYGKITHRLFERGESWLPLSPTNITYQGNTILVDFHVPEPPLQFQSCYIDTTPTLFSDAGFSVTDSVGSNPVSAVVLVGDTVVQITCARLLIGPVTVNYAADSAHTWSGNLCDSDPTVSNTSYQYTDFSGQSPCEELENLVSSPYPLWNWCVVFSMPATAS
jgi:hypothetical protein